MKKGKYLFSLVTIMLLTGLAEAISGFILWFALPSGGGRRNLALTYWGLTRHSWIDIHDWVAIALVVIVAIHLIIHWKWVMCITRNLAAQLTEAFRSIKGDSTVTTDSKSE
jgi:hypothetical protein